MFNPSIKKSMNNDSTEKTQYTKDVFRDLGIAIQQLREHNGLTIEQAAILLETTPLKVAAIERGSLYNNINELARIVESIGGKLLIAPVENVDDPHCQFIEFE